MPVIYISKILMQEILLYICVPSFFQITKNSTKGPLRPKARALRNVARKEVYPGERKPLHEFLPFVAAISMPHFKKDG